MDSRLALSPQPCALLAPPQRSRSRHAGQGDGGKFEIPVPAFSELVSISCSSYCKCALIFANLHLGANRPGVGFYLSLIHISEPTRRTPI
eukprot:6174980-Pleurochrysis_carterae.AAC.4